jgi:diaminopimelate epimerase
MEIELMRILFSKYQGAGNDFILINDLDNVFPDKEHELISKLCDRRFGVGADGLMLLRPSNEKDFTMMYFNSDGYEGTMCGNGGRCLVAFARDCRCINKDFNIVFDAIDGAHSAEILHSGLVSLKMINVDCVVDKLGGYLVETGSTHHVEYVEGLASMNVLDKGRFIRMHDKYSPLGCNVNFIEEFTKSKGYKKHFFAK